VKERILQTLHDLRAYALSRGYQINLFYHEEDSSLMRFANSAISLNTNEHLIRLMIMAYTGKKRASYTLITNLDQVDEMKHGVDMAADMANLSQPLSYQPTLPEFRQSFVDESYYDSGLAEISNAGRLAYFSQAVADLATDGMVYAGIFSSGATTLAQMSTLSDQAQYFITSDAQINTVLSHPRLKWEVRAAQSAQSLSDLDADRIRRDLAFLSSHYHSDTAQQLPLGKYDIVFGSAATAEMLDFMNNYAYNGGMMKRGFSFLSQKDIGAKVLSERISMVDDPTNRETFPRGRDFYGLLRRPFPLFQKGVFQGFTWGQDDADEYGEEATGHTVDHLSLVVGAGDQPVSALEELLTLPRSKDLLYVPYLHYMNVVNPSRGILTGSSRFGAMLLKRDGGVTIPYNVRITLSLLELFGDKVAWLSQSRVAYNLSQSYGARNPQAMVVPQFVCVTDLDISHSNASY
jgi:predicted Zn-dependent protease